MISSFDRYAFPILCTSVFVLNIMAQGAVSQESIDCPEGYTCITPDASICLSEQALNEHEQDVANCRRDLEQTKGQLSQCRINVENRDNRIEALIRDKARCESDLASCQKKLDHWSRKPWLTIPGGAIGGAGITAGVCLSR